MREAGLLVLLVGACSGDGKSSDSSGTTPPDDSSADAADSGGTVSSEWGAISVDPDAVPPHQLSKMQLVRWKDGGVEYNDGVVPYSMNTPLFSDFALKDRAIWIPDGGQASWDEGTVLDFPVGTVVMKTFLVSPDLRDSDAPLQIVETRLLIRGTSKWAAWPYIWHEDGSDAYLHVGGKVLDHTFIDAHGESRTAHYLVPQRNQCVDCHETYDDSGERALRPLGPEPRLMHDGVVLERLVADGQLTGAPELSTVTPSVDWADIEARGVEDLSSEEVVIAARDYLHVNCAHCHSPRGIEGITSQFFLNWDNDDPFHLGICKRPGSAGEGGEDRYFDIVPGNPDASILWYRTATEDVGAMMPDIGRSLAHNTGAELIWRWIAEMESDDCSSDD